MNAEENDRANVLLVDDEENILKSLKRLLMEEDIDIITATSGEAGLEILRNTPGVGLIVSDQRMPGMTGAEFLEKSRDIVPDAFRIMLTGYADINATIDAINKGGAYRYLSKPWDDGEMLRTIRDAVRQSRLLSENKRLSALVEKQNGELKEWNASLKSRVLEQTAAIRKRSDELNDLNEKLKMNFEKSIASFASLLELRDKEIKNHSRNVAKLSENMAKVMHLSVREVETIKIAALLHDIGKIGMSDKLLNMNAIGINLDGIVEYRNHPIRGQAAIDSIEDLREAGTLIRHHHENYDGSGYPDKLRGDEIPVGSRIIALADKFDHLLRKQQGDKTIEIPLDEIKSGLIRKFDSSLFPFLEMAAKEFYRKFSEEVVITEMEIQPKDMQEGMVVSKDVRSGTGILLLCESETLDQVKINAITRYYNIDPPKRGIFVKVYNEADS